MVVELYQRLQRHRLSSNFTNIVHERTSPSWTSIRTLASILLNESSNSANEVNERTIINVIINKIKPVIDIYDRLHQFMFVKCREVNLNSIKLSKVVWTCWSNTSNRSSKCTEKIIQWCTSIVLLYSILTAASIQVR